MRRLAGALLVAGAILAPATPAFAHDGTGGESSDYRIEITGFEGDSTGFELRVVQLGDRMELRRTTAATVEVPGYEGEPYLRLDADGVFENLNSPSYYLNLDRYGRTQRPATATADAAPDWQLLSDSDTVQWHDHRTHWMDTVPRDDVRADPEVERVIFPANRVDMVVDGAAVTAIVRVSWLPPPSHLRWIGLASVLGCAVLAAMVLNARARALVPWVALAASIAVTLGQGMSTPRLVIGGAMALVAVLALVIRKPWLSLGAAGASGILAITRFEVFEHELLAGHVPAIAQRVAIVMALAAGLGVGASALVNGISPTRPGAPGH